MPSEDRLQAGSYKGTAVIDRRCRSRMCSPVPFGKCSGQEFVGLRKKFGKSSRFPEEDMAFISKSDRLLG